MTLFLSGFKHFHGALPTGPHQWPLQTGTGKVRLRLAHPPPPDRGRGAKAERDATEGISVVRSCTKVQLDLSGYSLCAWATRS
jgi:hypothetical protein